MNQEIENLSGSLEKEIKENFGFKEEALIGLLKEHPRAVQIMGAQSLVFETDEVLIFPTPVSPKDEAADPELAAKLGRSARDTIRQFFSPAAVGRKMVSRLEEIRQHRKSNSPR